MTIAHRETRTCWICCETWTERLADGWASCPTRGIEGRWCCPDCCAKLANTHCDVCLDEFVQSGIVATGGNTLACLRCEPEEFGPEYAALRLSRLADMLARLGRQTSRPDLLTAASLARDEAADILETIQ